MIRNHTFFTSGTARDDVYFEQQFIVTGGIDCRLRSTIYTRISERNILTWIQEVTGNIIYIDCIYEINHISPKEALRCLIFYSNRYHPASYGSWRIQRNTRVKGPEHKQMSQR